MEMKLTPRFYQDGERIFGPGVAELMQQVQVHRSLRSAAQAMEMAYSKAWRIIRNAEEGFGCKLLNSTIGGHNGGGAVLTPEGEQILAAYQRFSADINAYSQARFQELPETGHEANRESPELLAQVLQHFYDAMV